MLYYKIEYSNYSVAYVMYFDIDLGGEENNENTL